MVDTVWSAVRTSKMDLQWQLKQIEGDSIPSERYGHAAFSVKDGEVLVIGGKTTRAREEFKILNLQLQFSDRHIKKAQFASEPFQLNTSSMLSMYGKDQGRWAFASTYCQKENVIFLHGGFDSACNYGDTRLFLPHQPSIRSICTDSFGPSPRGYHSAVYVTTEASSLDSNSVLVFGGQCCVGGPYQYYNDVFRFCLEESRWSEVETTGDTPSPRSQSFMFFWSDALYVYGGYDGSSIFTDLHKLDLKTSVWHRLTPLNTPCGPTGLTGLTPANFHVYSARPAGVVVGSKVLVLGESYDTGMNVLHCLCLRSLRWSILGEPQCKLHAMGPPARGNATMTLVNGTLLVVGGHERNLHRHARPNHNGLRFLWTISLPRPLTWERERLLWIACYKNSREECNLAKCPPHIIYHIIRLCNKSAFYV